MKLGAQQAKGHLGYSQVEGGCSEAARLQAGKRTCGLRVQCLYVSSDPRVHLAIERTSLGASLSKLFQQKKLNSDFFCMCLSSSRSIPMIPPENMPRFYSFNVKQDDFISIL